MSEIKTGDRVLVGAPMMSEAEAFAAASLLEAANAPDVMVHTHDRAVGDDVVTYHSVRTIIRDARHGNVILRQVNLLPTEAECAAIVASMWSEATKSAKATRQRQRTEREMDRE